LIDKLFNTVADILLRNLYAWPKKLPPISKFSISQIVSMDCKKLISKILEIPDILSG
jgi:hypothetical protein